MAGNFFDGEFFGGGFFGALVQPVGPIPSGGIPSYADQRRTKKKIREARERFGIPDEVRIAIETVAKQQVDRLERDKQKQFEELNRELELRGLEFEGRYLESLNQARERLITAEISLRIREKMIADEESLMLLVLMAAV